METLAATPINLLTPADVQGRRNSSEASADDAGSFEQLLGDEIALVSSDGAAAAGAAGAELLATTLTPASDERTQPADGTQILDSIIDSASLLPVAATPALLPNVEGMKPAGETRARHDRAVTSAALQASAAAPETRIEPTVAQAIEAAPPDTAHVVPAETQMPAARASVAQAAATAGTTMPATLAALSAGTAPPPEALALAQKTAAAGQKPATTAAAPAPSAARETRENREPAGMQPRDEPLAIRAESAVDRPQVETFVTGSVTDRASALDISAQPASTSSSLDALSSAALMPKWAPASHTSNANSVSTPATARIDTPLGTEAWGDAFRQKVVWLVDRQQQSAELHVNPPHLGPVEVMLNLGDDGAHIVFCSPHASVREAIEASLAELRTALASNGLSLGQALVSGDPGAAREQFREEMARGTQSATRSSAEPLPATEIPSTRPLRQGLVDIFA